ncbi:MAG TPA: metallophosphoesterase family protein [Kofleriaceae bacterium]|nr:metallophosphoesterase family protein [Kofleriaceae bacterium]
MDAAPATVPVTPVAAAAPATPDAAVNNAEAIIDLLLTVGHVDGVFHQRERSFVARYLESVLSQAEDLAGGGPELRTWIHAAYQAHFDTVYQRVLAEVVRLTSEVYAVGDGAYLVTRLKLRALATFRGLAPRDQVTALELLRAFMHSDGIVSEPEEVLYQELLAYFVPPTPAGPSIHSFTGPAVSAPTALRPMAVLAPCWNPLKAMAHPLLEPLEQSFSPHPVELQSQLALDWQLVGHALQRWQDLRRPGHGLLTGITDIDQIPAGAQFLDGHVHVLRPRRPIELVVLGDLHGCYACLKAALLQSDFVNRAWLHQWDPHHYPDVKLVLLGDYIDRGRFSFDGVLRAVLQLFVAMPDNVFVLRGNHEYFLERNGQIWSGVHPAEGLFSIAPYAPRELLEAYRMLFEEMPTSLLFDRTLFVHGGIPREDSLAAHYRDLSSLGDPELRFQMLWSDPTQVDEVPIELQKHSARFNFGRRQFRSFMERIGCHTLIRGHEQIEPGFDIVYDLGDRLLLNLFSAGGADNRDLPPDCAYRKVRPMALTIVQDQAGLRAVPWPIEYQPFNYETRNGFYRPAPLLEHRYT